MEPCIYSLFQNRCRLHRRQVFGPRRAPWPPGIRELANQLSGKTAQGSGIHPLPARPPQAGVRAQPSSRHDPADCPGDRGRPRQTGTFPHAPPQPPGPPRRHLQSDRQPAPAAHHREGGAPLICKIRTTRTASDPCCCQASAPPGCGARSAAAAGRSSSGGASCWRRPIITCA
jgi:hypothetical protein